VLELKRLGLSDLAVPKISLFGTAPGGVGEVEIVQTAHDHLAV
jgi:hypothetical protein